MRKEKDEWKKRFYDSKAFLENDNLLSFFSGHHVNYRMDELRKSIHYVRNNWDDREKLIGEIFRVFPNLGIDEEVLKKKDWLDVASDIAFNEKDFSIIHKYTEQRGYDIIFNSMNRLLRSLDAPSEKFHAAALLVEFLNIDLYNYIKTHPERSQFDGIIYRGLPVTQQAIDGLNELFFKPARERGFGIPLGFLSASKKEETAIEFAKDNVKKYEPLVLKIHVLTLSQDLLGIYKSFYPDSIVTSLCSVPIYDLSAFPCENEVLLRGAFFQVLRTYRESKINVVEACMLNANRDHVKTNELNGTCAQKLFGKLVQLDKMRKCSDLVRSWNPEAAFLYDEEAKKAAYELEEAIQACRAERERKLKEASK